MGRGSGGVAQFKGKSLSAEQSQAVLGYSYRQIRKAVEGGFSTENAEKTAAKMLRKIPTDILAKRQERDLYYAAMLEGKQGKGDEFTQKSAEIAYKTYDKLELLERKELMRRDPQKYDSDWVANAFAKARKKAGK